MATPHAARKPVPLDVWLADYPFTTDTGDPIRTPMRRMAERFVQAHPEYRVRITTLPFPDVGARVRAAALAGRVPDLVTYYAADTRQALDAVKPDGRPCFVPFESAVAGRREVLGEPVVTDDLVPTVADSYRLGGQLAALPLTVTTFVLYANRALLQQAGITELPRTWAELEQASKHVVASGVADYGVTWANHGVLCQQAVAQQGACLAELDNGRAAPATSVRLAQDAVLNWVRWWRQLHRDRLYLRTAGPGDWMGAFTAFAEQRVAFLIDSSKAVPELTAAGRHNGFEVQTGPMPYNSAVPYAGNPVSGDALWLAADTDPVTRDGSIAFAQFLLNPDNVATWHRATGFVPVTEAGTAVLREQGWFATWPQHPAACEQLASSDRSAAALGPVLNGLATVDDHVAAAIDDVLVDDADPVQRLTAASVAANAAISRNSEPGLPDAPEYQEK